LANWARKLRFEIQGTHCEQREGQEPDLY